MLVKTKMLERLLLEKYQASVIAREIGEPCSAATHITRLYTWPARHPASPLEFLWEEPVNIAFAVLVDIAGDAALGRKIVYL